MAGIRARNKTYNINSLRVCVYTGLIFLISTEGRNIMNTEFIIVISG